MNIESGPKRPRGLTREQMKELFQILAELKRELRMSSEQLKAELLMQGARPR
jgi:hypothetical protein